MLLRLITFFSCLLYCGLIAWGVQAKTFEKGDVLLRGRLVAVVPDVSGTLIPVGGDPYISSSVLPELDLSYFLTDNISVEGILGIIPHKAKAVGTSIGDRDAGRIFAVAPTVMLQYHYEVKPGIIPYLGMGMAYVKYFEDDTVDQVQYEDDIAALVQAGVDIVINDKWSANIDVKRAWAGTKAKVNGGEVTGDINIDPTIYGVGLGYKF